MTYSKGEWITGVGNIGAGEADHICVALKENKNKILALTGYVGASDEPESIANANLLVEAVNACIKLNHDNPVAVAKSISDMYEALKGLSPCMRTVPGGETPFEWAISERAMEAVRQALAKAEGK